MGESLKIFQINAFGLLTNLSIPESDFQSNQIVKFKPKINRKFYSETRPGHFTRTRRPDPKKPGSDRNRPAGLGPDPTQTRWVPELIM